MYFNTALPAICPDHGTPKNRQACPGCNAAYMRDYLRRRSREQPEWAVHYRAKKRAERLRIAFDLPLQAVIIPTFCPVLEVRLVIGKGRLPESPSLDRINPNKGYVVGNCRVISDKANRLKSNLDLIALKARAKFGATGLRGDYAKVVDYVDREELLAQVRQKAAIGGSAADDLKKVADWLDRRFSSGPVH
jgi:hypothetical protein